MELRIKTAVYGLLALFALSTGLTACKKDKPPVIKLPQLTTNSVSAITNNSAISGGNIISDGGSTITASGICWGTSENPTIENNPNVTTDGLKAIGSFSSSMSGLIPVKDYYVRAYATNSAGTAYGEQVSFKTQSNLPVVTTTSLTNITATSVATGGNITDDGGSQITSRGVCWGLISNPTIVNNPDIIISGSGPGEFTSLLSGLIKPNNTYFIRAFATNSAGTAYGNELTFTTPALALPTITINENFNNVTLKTANGSATIQNDGNGTIIQSGLCWDINPNPTTQSSSHSTDGLKTVGSFSSTLTNLISNNLYYVRAYATNEKGTAYSDQVSFKTATSKITDSEGNEYYTITIGNQEWMMQNLKTTVFNDAAKTPIANVTDNAEWKGLVTPAFCWYNNDKDTYKDTYGALYNWYAVNDPNGIAPTGYHVATKGDWDALISYLGGSSIAGAKLKEAGLSHWLDPNTGATNESGFTALPGGTRSVFAGAFSLLNSFGYFWTASQTSQTNANYVYLTGTTINAVTGTNDKKSGFSVRCVKD